MDAPILYVIAGPNGIGKTTSAFDLIPTGIPIINSDEIAAAVRNAGIINTNTQEYSNREAIRLMNEYLQKHSSFAIETNLADLETWKFLLETQKTGYNINLVYLSTDSLDVLNSRIEQRTLAGEHYIRPDIVQERYINSLHLLHHYFTKPDAIQLFDNSKSLTLVAELKHGQILKLSPSLPNWVDHYLGDHLKQQIKQEKKQVQDMDSIEEVRKSYLINKEKSQLLSEELKKSQELRDSEKLKQDKKLIKEPKQDKSKKIPRRPKL